MNASFSSHHLSRRQLGALSIGASALLAGLQATPSMAQGKPPEEGLDYIKLGKPAPTDAPKGKIEVVEFFWYHCPHCNHFEPTLEAWLKKLPKDVHFKRVPVAFQEAAVPLQKLYYTLEAMGKVNEMQRKVFTAIHADKQNLNKSEAIVAWAVKQGFDEKKFVEIFNSFAVNTKVSRAKQLSNDYKIQGVPSLGVAGKFYTDSGLAKGMTRALQVVEFLANEAKVK